MKRLPNEYERYKQLFKMIVDKIGTEKTVEDEAEDEEG